MSATNTRYMQEIEQSIQSLAFSKALTLCDEFLYRTPSNTSVMIARAWCLHKIGLADEASTLFDSIECDNPSTLANVSYIDVMRLYDFFWNMAVYDKLIDVCMSYLHHYPQDSAVLRKLAAAHSRLAEYRLAAIFYKRALKIDGHISTEYNLGLTLLQLGQYDEGFRLYEKRHEVHGNPLNKSVFTIPKWGGEPIENKGIIVWCEQGLGDVIQFSRYVTLLVEKGATVTLLLTKQYETLATLLTNLSGVNEVAVLSEGKIRLSGNYHYHMPLMSAMYHFGLQLNNIPASIPYLSASPSPALDNHINTLAALSGLKVGVVWSTVVEQGVDSQPALIHQLKNEKSIPFSMFSHLFTLEGISFVNLKLPLSDYEQQQLNVHGVVDFSGDISTFSDTAALLEVLDIVISIDTSVAHLAGAMGKPTINLLPYDSDWRWQQHRDDTPWYPTMSLYRQIYREQWEDVIDRVKETLQKTVLNHQKTGLVSIN